MRSPISPVSAWYALLCLSLIIQVEYSFCRMRLSATGFTLPWQLVAAHEPGPRYLADSFSAAPRKFGNAHNVSNAVQKPIRRAKWNDLDTQSFRGIQGF